MFPSQPASCSMAMDNPSALRESCAISPNASRPKNAILGFAQLLEMSRKEPLTPNQKDRIRQIVKGGQHLLDLINEILDISRIEANRVQISPEPVSIRESVQEVLDLATPLAVKRHI